MDEARQRDLAAQLAMIESMIRDGQRSMGRWGWSFVMWGVAHLAGMAATRFFPARAGIAWGILMGGCGIAMAVVGTRRRRARGRSSTIDRALSAVWLSFGCSLAVLWLAGGAGHLYRDNATFLSIFFALVGSANVASALILRARVQGLVGVAWLVAAAAALLAPAQVDRIFVAAALLLEVGFGLWLTARERAEADLG